MGRKKRKNNMEFSKKIIIAVGIINVIVIGYSIVLMWVTKDTSPLCYLIPSVAAEMSTASGFYFNKAKKENSIKLAKSNGIPINENTIHSLIQ